jgi:hypothetical protein
MDPNVVRNRLVALAERLVDAEPAHLEWQNLFSSAAELADAALALDEWLQKGGFLPRVWQGTRKGAADTLLAIHQLMDGVEWGPATLESIAENLRSAGYTIHEPGELTEGDEEG